MEKKLETIMTILDYVEVALYPLVPPISCIMDNTGIS